MVPIHELLARIQWDRDFGAAEFELAYLDRRKLGLVRLPLDRIVSRTAFGFEAEQDDGTVQAIPYHRVRELRRNGAVIWSRLAPRLGKASRAADVRPPASRHDARPRTRDARRRHTP